MGSNSKDVQQAQKERAEKELSLRLEILAQRGLTTEKVEKDKVVRHLRADLKTFDRRLTTIDEQTALLEKVAKEKAAKAAKPKKKKKKAKEEAKPGGGKKKKKKKPKKV